jgi:hypothetical protein
MIINKGRIVADGTSEELRKQAQGNEILRIRIEEAPPDEVFEKLRSIETVDLVDFISKEENTFEVQSKKEMSSRKAIFNLCVENHWILTEMSPIETKLEDIFRVIPFREERITLTGHWHILSVLTATIVLMYIIRKIFPIKRKIGNVLGWIIIISSDLAFAMITIFSIKRLWVIEEAQQVMVDTLHLFSEIGLGFLLTTLGVYMTVRLVDFLKNGKAKIEE